MMAGETPTIFGDGLTSRDFNFVNNAVSANLLCMPRARSVATGRVFNIGTGRSHTLNEVYTTIAEQLGFTAAPLWARAVTSTLAGRHPSRQQGAGLPTQGALPRGPAKDRGLVPGREREIAGRDTLTEERRRTGHILG